MSTLNEKGYKIAKLICCSEKNNNKFYEMEQISDTEFVAKWGRVGGRSDSKTYPMKDWDKKYKDKLHKGSKEESYEDVTHLRTETINEDKSSNTKIKQDDLAIQNEKIKKLIIQLQQFAGQSVQTNYKVQSKDVTQQMLDEANLILNDIIPAIKIGADINILNKNLIQLYKVIPRKMSNVKDHIFKDITDEEYLKYWNKKIDDERAILQSMASQVITNNKLDTNLNASQIKTSDYLSTLGLELEECNAEDIKFIKGYMKDYDGKDSSREFYQAFKVKNKTSYERYQKWLENYKNKGKSFTDFLKKDNSENILQLWHGSRNKVWWFILQSDLKIFPNAVNASMFGRGNYFSSKYAKSRGYTSHRSSKYTGESDNVAYLAILDVHVGNQMIIKKWSNDCTQLNYEKIKKQGFDSVYAPAGYDCVNDETIIYNEDQSTLKYLLEIR